MSRGLKILFGVAVLLVIVTIVGVVAIKFYQNKFAAQVSETTVSDVDLSKVADGTYTGTYKIYPVDVEVGVTVKDHKIIGIDLIKHVNGKGKPAEVIPSKVIETQSLKVDTVSGATASSKVILKAIENALDKGVK